MSTWALLGLASGLISLIDPVPYVRDVLRGATRPHRGTWLIWSLLGATAFASQWAGGASWSLIMVGVQTAGVIVVFGLSISRGEGGLSRRDGCLIAVAGLGILGWAISADPLVATGSVLVADLAGAVMMLPKTWRDPRSETLSTFVLAAAAGGLSTAAVQGFEPSLLLYPAYFALINAATALVILLRRRAVPLAPAAATSASGAALDALTFGLVS